MKVEPLNFVAPATRNLAGLYDLPSWACQPYIRPPKVSDANQSEISSKFTHDSCVNVSSCSSLNDTSTLTLQSPLDSVAPTICNSTINKSVPTTVNVTLDMSVQNTLDETLTNIPNSIINADTTNTATLKQKRFSALKDQQAKETKRRKF